MSIRKIAEKQASEDIRITVVKDSDNNQYEVRTYWRGLRHEPSTGYEDSREDAIGTMNEVARTVARWGGSVGRRMERAQAARKAKSAKKRAKRRKTTRKNPSPKKRVARSKKKRTYKSRATSLRTRSGRTVAQKLATAKMIKARKAKRRGRAAHLR